MNKNPLNINSNLPKWETPLIYSVRTDKNMIKQMMSLGEGEGAGGGGGDGDGENEEASLRPELYSTGGSTDYNPFDYNSFDENPFTE